MAFTVEQQGSCAIAGLSFRRGALEKFGQLEGLPSILAAILLFTFNSAKDIVLPFVT